MQRRDAMKLAGAGAASLAGCLGLVRGSESWPQYAANGANTGITSNTAPDGEPSIRWDVEADDNFAGQPAVADGVVYSISTDETLYAFDTESGDRRWTFDLEFANYSFSTPAVADGIVYVASSSGVLYALDQDDGAVEWEFDTGSSINLSPTVADDTVYLWSRPGRTYNLYAIDATTGEKQWDLERSETYAGLSPPAVVDGAVYTGPEAIEAETGEVLWADPDGRTRYGPTVVDDTVYCAGVLEFGDPNPWAGEPNVHGIRALDVETGDERWRNEDVGYSSRGIAVTETTMYISDSGGIHAVDTATGDHQRIWDIDATNSHLTLLDGTVYMAASNSLYALDAETSDQRWRYDYDAHPSLFGYSPVIVDGVIYQVCLPNTLLALE